MCNCRNYYCPECGMDPKVQAAHRKAQAGLVSDRPGEDDYPRISITAKHYSLCQKRGCAYQTSWRIKFQESPDSPTDVYHMCPSHAKKFVAGLLTLTETKRRV